MILVIFCIICDISEASLFKNAMLSSNSSDSASSKYHSFSLGKISYFISQNHVNYRRFGANNEKYSRNSINRRCRECQSWWRSWQRKLYIKCASKSLHGQWVLKHYDLKSLWHWSIWSFKVWDHQWGSVSNLLLGYQNWNTDAFPLHSITIIFGLKINRLIQLFRIVF